MTGNIGVRIVGLSALAVLGLASLARPGLAQSAPGGAQLFQQRCAVCHSVGGKGGKIGPDLKGVVGRRAGSTAFAYSPALKKAPITWSAKSLDTYLAAPSKMVPGTRMTVAIPNARDRGAIIGYLGAQR